MSKTAPKLDETQGIRPFFPGLTDTSALFLKGTMGMTKTGSRDHYGGSRVDVYKPVLTSLSVTDDDGTVVREIADPDALQRIHDLLDDAIKLPLYEMLTEEGGPPPEHGHASFRVPFDRANILVWNQSRFMTAIIGPDSDAISRDMAWVRFSNSTSFDRHPCSREFFEGVRDEFMQSPSWGVMEIGQYYDFLVRSAERLDDQGELLPEAKAEATNLVDTWIGNGDRDEGSLSYWTNRNLNVHPRHKGLYDAVVAERLEATAPRPTPSP